MKSIPIKKIAITLLIIGIIVTLYSITLINNGTKVIIDVDSTTGGYSITYYEVALNDILLENIGIVLISISLTLFITTLGRICKTSQ